MRRSVVLAVGALMLLAMAVAGRVEASGADQVVANGLTESGR